MNAFLMEYFKWNRIIGHIALAIICAYYIVKTEYTAFKEAEEEVNSLCASEVPNPNFVPPSTAKPLEIELSREPYLDSIQAYNMDDLECVGEHYEYVYSNGNIVYLPFKARKAHTIYIEYVYRKGIFFIPHMK